MSVIARALPGWAAGRSMSVSGAADGVARSPGGPNLVQSLEFSMVAPHAALPKCVAVTGASGFVGRHVVRALREAGAAEVRALGRDAAKCAHVLPTDDHGVHVVLGDVFERNAIDELLHGVDAVVHCIGVRRELPGASFERMHVDATRAVIEGCERTGASRFIHISALGTRANAPTAYWRTKHKAEQVLRASSLRWTIIRPSLIHGPDGEFMHMTKGWALSRNAPWVAMPYFAHIEMPTGFPPKLPRFVSALIQPVAVEDVAKSVIESLRREQSIEEVYALGGPERLTWPELLRHVCDHVPMANRNKPMAPMPVCAGRAMAMIAKPLGLSDMLPFCESEPAMAGEDNTCELDKVRTHLGIVPSPFREAVAGYAERI